MRILDLALSLGMAALAGGCASLPAAPEPNAAAALPGDLAGDPGPMAATDGAPGEPFGGVASAPGPAQPAAGEPLAGAASASPDEDVAADGAVASAPGQADSAFDWQRALADDIDLVEARGDAFLEASFNLYDQLLEAKAGAAGPPGLPRSVQLSADRYAEMTDAIDRLRLDLAKPETREALLTTDIGRKEFDAVTALFSAYQAAPKHPAAYDGAQGPSMTAVLFGAAARAETPGLTGLPKPQRDALRLLDALRDVSNDLAYLSHTVTDWVDVRGRLGLANEEFSH